MNYVNNALLLSIYQVVVNVYIEVLETLISAHHFLWFHGY